MSLEIVRTYTRDKNLSDIEHDELEQDFLYFRLSVLSDWVIKYLFLDIMNSYGKGIVSKIAKHILSVHAKNVLNKGIVPTFKEEYAFHYLNKKDTGEQFVLVILALLNVIEHTPANMRKLKDIIDYSYKKFSILNKSKKNTNKNIINYV